MGVILVNQIIGARAGNIESNMTTNVYIFMQFMLAISLGVQWFVIFGKYQVYKEEILSD